MLVEVRLERKVFVTSRALKVLGWRVGLHVGPQVGPVGKRLLTHGAQVGLVASVRAQVTLQQPRPGEGLVAHGALVAQVMSQHVHRQGGHGHVHLAADMALLGRVGVQTPVGLLVAAQVGAGGVVLATL